MPAIAAAIPGVLVNLAIGVGVNLVVGAAVNALTGGAANDNTGPRGSQFDVSYGLGKVWTIYGRQAVAGDHFYKNEYGENNEYLQLVRVCGRGWYDALEAVYVNGKKVTLSGSNADARGWSVAEYTRDTPYLWIKAYFGGPDQTADAELVARANPAGRWTESHKLTWTPYVIVTLRLDDDFFGGAVPSLLFQWRGLKLYDRRLDSTQPGGSGAHRWGDWSTYEWSENAAICQDNWRRGLWLGATRVLGLGVSEYDTDHARTVAAANICDEGVTYPDTGRTLRRYTFGGIIEDGTDPIAVMASFEAAMGGQGCEFGGAYAPLPAQTLTPVLTLTDADRVTGAPYTQATRMSPLEVKNAVGGNYSEPDQAWQPIEYGIRRDATVETQEGGQRLASVDFLQVNYREQAAMLAEILRRADRFSATESATFGPKAAVLEAGDLVTRQSAGPLGTMTMRVISIEEDQMSFKLELRQWDNSIVPSPTAGFVPLPPTVLPAAAPSRPTTLSGLLAVAISEQSGESGEVPAIRVTFTPITDPTVDRAIVQYWVDGKPDDVRYASSDNPASGSLVIEGVAPETTYWVSGNIVTTPPRVTSWCPAVAVTTGPLTVGVADGAVTPAKLGADLQAIRNWEQATISALVDQVSLIAASLQDQDVANYVDVQQVMIRLQSTFGQAQASINSVAEALATATAAIATIATNVMASTDGNVANAVYAVKAEASDDGAQAKVVQGLNVTNAGGQVTLAFEEMEVDSAGKSIKTFVCKQLRATNPAGTYLWQLDLENGNSFEGRVG